MGRSPTRVVRPVKDGPGDCQPPALTIKCRRSQFPAASSPCPISPCDKGTGRGTSYLRWLAPAVRCHSHGGRSRGDRNFRPRSGTLPRYTAIQDRRQSRIRPRHRGGPGGSGQRRCGHGPGLRPLHAQRASLDGRQTARLAAPEFGGGSGACLTHQATCRHTGGEDGQRPNPAPRRNPKRGLKAGDNVEFDWGGETIRAQVVGLDPRTGAVRIRYQWQGREWNEVRPAAAFRPRRRKTGSW